MKSLSLISLAGLLLAGCSTYHGGTGSSTETTTGSGTSPQYNRTVNDMDDLGYNGESYKNMKPNGQPRVPGHAVDIDNGPR
jgi:PBP1b-binding outer membrane lipoprotein LpoB